MKVVISLGGSVVNPGEPDVEFVKKMCAMLSKLSKGVELLIVCGGGVAARKYAHAIQKLGNNFLADEAAILATHQNAIFVSSALPNSVFCKEFDDARKMHENGKIPIMGGTVPGITTDDDAVLLAELVGAKRVVNLSNVDAIYDSDPKTNPKAKRFEKMKHDELIALATGGDKRRAGENFVFTLLACKLAARSNIEVHFVNGRNLEEAEAAILGKKHSGTVVS